MKNQIKTIVFAVIVSVGLGLSTNAVVQSTTKASAKQVTQSVITKKTVTTTTTTTAPTYELVNAIDVVSNPAKYLNKHIKVKATFDKFSTLGLDYKPAFRSSEKYISFLIKRDDSANHTVPLSEMKIFLLRDIAEKYIDLSSGDTVEFSGVVFSNALGDAWVSVDKFTVLTQKSKDAKDTKNNSTKK